MVPRTQFDRDPDFEGHAWNPGGDHALSQVAERSASRKLKAAASSFPRARNC